MKSKKITHQKSCLDSLMNCGIAQNPILVSTFKNSRYYLLRVLILLCICFEFSTFCFSQLPSVKVRDNEFPHDGNVINGNDWLFSVFEDNHLDLVCTGYTRDTIFTGSSAIYPSLVKTDADLNPLFTIKFTEAFDAEATQQTLTGFGALFEALEYIDPDDGLPYYVAVGYSRLAGVGNDKVKLLIVKTELDGTLVTGFPRIYTNSIDVGTGYGLEDDLYVMHERRGRGIKYDPTDGGYFYIAGADDERHVFID